MITYARTMIRSLVADEKGVTAIEYGLIAALIAMLVAWPAIALWLPGQITVR